MSPEITISISEILVAVLAIIAGGLGYVIREQREKIKSIQNQLSDKKYKVYHEVYDIFFDFLKQYNKLQKKDDNAMTIRLIDVKKDLFIYAPDPVLKKFLDWNLYITKNPGDIRQILIFLEICILIRKDMGQYKTIITEVDILRSIMTTDAEFEKIKNSLI